MSVRWTKALFIVAGIYDLLIGAASLFAAGPIFRLSGVTPPNHMGYVQFPAVLVAIFGVMFLRIAADPIARCEQILYGILLKASYCGVILWYQFHGGVPALWIPCAWIDLAFLILFVFAWRALSAKEALKSSAVSA